MQFFVPYCDNQADADQVYESIRKFMLEVAFPPTDRKIYSVSYRHNGKPYTSTVGKEERGVGEQVIAILESANHTEPLFMICTPNRGVLRGAPVLAGDRYASVVDFD